MRVTGTAKRIIQFVFSRPNFFGLASGTLWFCFSLTPSLLPRPATLQGFVTGISFAVGYGIGVWFSWVLRKVFHKEPPYHIKRYAWVVLGVAGGTSMASTVVLFFVHWQNEVRRLVDEPPLESGHRIRILVIAALVAAALILCSRFLYWLVQRVDRRLARFVPRRFTGAAAAVLVAFGLYFVLNGIAYQGFVRFANTVYSRANDATPAGVTQPASPYRSGGKDSLVSWQSLGKQGRRFTGTGPTEQQLRSFSGHNPANPIRVYAGLGSAATTKDRARLAVQELERTHAFERQVLVVTTPTGTGWVNPQTADALEYMWNGDTAIVAIQYSYLPSWISFIVDKENATSAGRELFTQVYDHWAQLPEGHRPKLIAYGLSLGSYGMQAAFSGEDDIKARTNGALFAGTPNDTFLWQDIEKNRDNGSPAWLPQYNKGQTTRFASQAADLEKPSGTWHYPRVVYLQHASDPIVWWSPDLLFKRPAWLAEQRGRDVSPNMHWFPISTFLQVSVDQFMGITAPDGHGHNYNTAPIDALAAITVPEEWTPAKTTALHAIIAAYPDR